MSDDGAEFCALDLPGICDAEDKKGTFDKVTREWAAKCDVVVWVTDARTAFLTTHEAREYAALRAAIQEKADEDGTLYQFLVVIAKYDVGPTTNTTTTSSTTPCTSSTGIRLLDGEIMTRTEDTTIEACFARVQRMFPATRVVKFSAFARILKSGSEALRVLVSAHTDGTNDTFDLKWATENLVEKQLTQMTRVLRSTRNRAVAAEAALQKVDKTLAVLMSRVAPSPVYDSPVELEVVQHTQDPRTAHQTVVSSPLYSFTIAMDAAVMFGPYAWSVYGPATMGQMSASPRVDIHCGRGLNDITQIIAPTVRPVYGDIIVVPAQFSLYSGGTGGAGGMLVIYAGTDVGEKYALKVGEVKRDQVAGLITVLSGKSGCNVRHKVP
jgi:hypothetical protein